MKNEENQRTKKSFIKRKEKQPAYIMSPMQNKMVNYHVYTFSAAEKIMYFLLTFVCGGIVGLVFYGGLFKEDGNTTQATLIADGIIFVAAGVVASWIFLPTIAKQLKNKRNEKLGKQFLDLLDDLSASLTAGSTVNDSFFNAQQALLNQYSRDDMIVRETSEIITGVENGHTLGEMLDNFAKRSDNEDIENFSNVMSNCSRLGGDFKSVVYNTRFVISGKYEIQEEIETKLTSNRMQHNAMCIMPIVLVGLMKLVSPSFGQNLATPSGIAVTTVAVGIFIGSFFWGRKIIDIH